MAPKRAPVPPETSPVPEASTLSLGARFSRLLDPSVAYTVEDVQTMPLEKLGETKILFGKAMKGRTFADTYVNEPAWVRWMLDHMATSSKMEHVAFITYVRRQVEEAETIEAHLLSPEGASDARGAKPKAAPKSVHVPPHEAHVWESTWDLCPEQGPSESESALQEQVTLLGERLSQMEGLMQQMIQHLSQSSQAA